jgi:glycosyltransferase involved in cell wall biosynthesis
LAEALRRALTDTEAAAEARARARQRIRAEFDPARWAARHLDVYRGLTAARGLPAPTFGGAS